MKVIQFPFTNLNAAQNELLYLSTAHTQTLVAYW